MMDASTRAADHSTHTSNRLNPLESPPQALKDLFKAWRPHSDPTGRQKCWDVEMATAKNEWSIMDLKTQETSLGDFSPGERFPWDDAKDPSVPHTHGKLYTIPEIPGLMVIPNLLPPAVQIELLGRLLHRDLSNPRHKTNLHLHHDIQYPADGASFFSQDPQSVYFLSKDGNSKKNLDIKRSLEKKMRWMTLGGQYDWTNKEYPPEEPPDFPEDIAKLIGGIFTDMEPQAAIVNLYSPGDTLSMHRDVSEEVDHGLVSVSLGCDAIFIIGLHDGRFEETKSAVLRLNSGDAVYMTGESRFAWHGVPWIIPDTCPTYFEDWPGEDFPLWKGWMKGKRINLNVRQMRNESGILKPLNVFPGSKF